MSEQRASSRSVSEASVSVVDVESGVAFDADVRNISTDGALMHAALEPAVGAELDVTFGDHRRAHANVTRVDATPAGFDVAVRIRR